MVVSPFGAAHLQVDIGRAYTAIQRQLDQYVDAIHPADYVRRFCSQLGMSAQDMKVRSMSRLQLCSHRTCEGSSVSWSHAAAVSTCSNAPAKQPQLSHTVTCCWLLLPHGSDGFGRASGAMLLSRCQVANEVAERASPRGAAKQGGEPKPWDGRTPISVAAGLILLVAVLPKVLLNPEPWPTLRCPAGRDAVEGCWLEPKPCCALWRPAVAPHAAALRSGATEDWL